MTFLRRQKNLVRYLVQHKKMSIQAATTTIITIIITIIITFIVIIRYYVIYLLSTTVYPQTGVILVHFFTWFERRYLPGLFSSVKLCEASISSLLDFRIPFLADTSSLAFRWTGCVLFLIAFGVHSLSALCSRGLPLMMFWFLIRCQAFVCVPMNGTSVFLLGRQTRHRYSSLESASCSKLERHEHQAQQVSAYGFF